LTTQAGKDGGIKRELMRRASHPAHLKTLLLLNDGPAGVTEIADHLGMSTAAAVEHLERMKKVGLVELVSERKLPGGGVEHFYRALVRGHWDDEEWAKLSLEERQRLLAWTLDVIATDARESIAGGSFAGRVDSHLSRSISLVDEQGWSELCRLQAEALEEVFAIEAASTERLVERGEEGISVMSAMICCEVPPRRGSDG
jgi:DNA-binding transcriptional ArsR family regulator